MIPKHLMESKLITDEQWEEYQRLKEEIKELKEENERLKDELKWWQLQCDDLEMQAGVDCE